MSKPVHGAKPAQTVNKGSERADATPQQTDPVLAGAQAPLGPQPAYDDVLDLAVEYTFPCSDPIAVDSCCFGIRNRAAPGKQPR